MSRLMRRPVRLLAATLRTLAAVTLTGLLVVGVPAALATQIGWPLPHTLPTGSELLDGLTAPLPDTLILNVLAVVCWLAWAQLTLGLIVETSAQLQGRAAPRLRLAGPLQGLAARLVGAALVTALLLPARAGVTPAPPPAVSVAAQQLHPAAAVTPHPPDTQQPDDVAAHQDRDRYPVRPRDTAWGLAETYSPDGDGLRWNELFALNEGRVQPDGDRWTDPGLLRPGWLLTFPEDWDNRPPAQPPAAADPQPAPPAPMEPDQDPAPAPPPSTAPGGGAQPSTPPPVDQAPDAPDDQDPDAQDPDAPDPDAQDDADDPAVAFRSPSGSIIWIGLAFGALLALEILRRRRRRHRHPAPPTPGLHHDPEPDTTDPALRWLEALARQPPTPNDVPDPGTRVTAPPELVSDRVQRHLTDPPPPGPVPIGHHHGTEITLDLAELGGLTLTGPGAPGVARAITTTALSGSAAVEVLLVGDELLGQVPTFQGVRRYPQLTAALHDLEVDLVHRTRQLDRTQTTTLAELHATDPAEPAPWLLLVTDHLDPGQAPRLRTLLDRGQHLGATALILDTPEPLGAHLEVTATSTVASGHPAALVQKLADAELFSLTTEDAAAILATLAAARAPDTPQPPPPPATRVAEPAPPEPTAPTPSATPDQPPPKPAPFAVPARPPGSPTPPVQVSALGGYQIRAGDTEVTSGMRRTAWELLLYFLLHPDGTSLATAVDTVWPDIRLGRESDSFWNALSSLRRGLRKATGLADLMVIQHDEDTYRIDPAAVDCDLWHFQAAVKQATQAPDNHHATQALTRAAGAYGGDLAGGAYGWAEPDRQHLRTLATDTLTRLADLREAAGNHDGAIATLTRATDTDPAAEETYRRLMRLQAAHLGIDAAERTYRRLETRLEELDVDVDPATARLRQELTQTHQRRQRARPTSQPRPPTPGNPQRRTGRNRPTPS